ncbi:hypothetical protein QBC47DRAFT_365198 [Echria macrotheca]|uniref:Uncharacterized protein n=1 Tax=Echria macrotheca TaxID=438768 RepID=A0AAJ0F0Y0_9PEZI|nr:hypothetical protein QBC47DRAFT_365198 [Echria macrotheca]
MSLVPAGQPALWTALAAFPHHSQHSTHSILAVMFRDGPWESLQSTTDPLDDMLVTMTSDDDPEVSSFPVGRKTQWMGAARPWMWCGLADVVRADWPTCRTTSHQKLAREDKAKPERTPSQATHSKFQVVLCCSTDALCQLSRRPVVTAARRLREKAPSASGATRRSHMFAGLSRDARAFRRRPSFECLSGKTVSPNSSLSQRLPITGRLMCVTRRGPPSNPMECSLTGAPGLQFGEPQTWASEPFGRRGRVGSTGAARRGYGFAAGGEAERQSKKLKHCESPSRRRPWLPRSLLIGRALQTHKHITAVHLPMQVLSLLDPRSLRASAWHFAPPIFAAPVYSMRWEHLHPAVL